MHHNIRINKPTVFFKLKQSGISGIDALLGEGYDNQKISTINNSCSTIPKVPYPFSTYLRRSANTAANHSKHPTISTGPRYTRKLKLLIAKLPWLLASET